MTSVVGLADPVTDFYGDGGELGDPEPVTGIDDDGNGPEPAAPPRRRPGPPPNPNSARSRRRAKAAAPRKRAVPNKAATPAAEPAGSVSQRGAETIIGWLATPLALAGMGMSLAAKAQPRLAEGRPSPRALRLDRNGEACTADSLTIGLHAPALAEGVAELADSGSIPWMAAALAKAAQIGPGVKLGGVMVALVMQIACNHGLVPAMPSLGTLTLAELKEASGIEAPAA